MNIKSITLSQFIHSMLAAMAMLVMVSCGGGGGGSGGSEGGLSKGTFKKDIVFNGDISNELFETSPVRAMGLYHSSDIQGAGYIVALRFLIGDVLLSDVTCNDTTIKIGHTNLTDLTTTYADAIETGQGAFVTVVNNAQITIAAGPSGRFLEIPLSIPFHYNGVDNLVVDISRPVGCSGSVDLDIAFTGPGYVA